jgi:transcriptional regulator with XRE-family HTH domain
MFTSERKRLRTRAGLTLSQLSKRTHISEGRLSQWERGECQLSPDEIMRASVALANELSEQIPSTAGEIFRAIERFRIFRRPVCRAPGRKAAENRDEVTEARA